MPNMRKLSRHLTSERGATAVEYIIAIILVAMVILGLAKVMGSSVMAKFNAGSSSIEKIDAKDGYAANDSSANANGNNNDDGSNGQSGKGGKNAQNGGKGGSGKGGKKGMRQGKDLSERPDMLPAAEKPKEKAGFNPIIIIIILGLVSVLGYVVYKGNKGGGSK